MDGPSVATDALRQSLTFIRRINERLGYTRQTVRHLAELVLRSKNIGKSLRILDVATGSGDVPEAILQWAREAGIGIKVVAIDMHPVTLAVARESSQGQFELVRADALRLPFADRSFDYVLCSMFLHHLSDDQIVLALREMDRVATRGLVVADLLRHYRALFWITLFTMRSNPMVQHDARASVRQALVRREVLEFRDRAGITYARWYRHFGHRFVLAGEKPDAG